MLHDRGLVDREAIGLAGQTVGQLFAVHRVGVGVAGVFDCLEISEVDLLGPGGDHDSDGEEQVPGSGPMEATSNRDARDVARYGAGVRAELVQFVQQL